MTVSRQRYVIQTQTSGARFNVGSITTPSVYRETGVHVVGLCIVDLVLTDPNDLFLSILVLIFVTM